MNESESKDENDLQAARPPILEAIDLARTYPDGNVQALRGVSIRVARGESVAITGPSGMRQDHLASPPRRPRSSHLGRGPVRGDVPVEARPRRVPGPPDRLRLPVVSPPAHPVGRRERPGADVRGRLPAPRSDPARRAASRPRSDFSSSAVSSPIISPSASASVSPSLGRWPTSRSSCSPTSRPETSTA